MAYNQDRALALVTAAIDYRDALHKLINTIQTHSDAHKKGKQSAEQALYLIGLIAAAPEQLMTNSKRTEYTIQFEHYHIQRTYRANKRKADYLRRKREAEGRTRRTYTHIANILPEIAAVPFRPSDPTPLSPSTVAPTAPLPTTCTECHIPTSSEHCGISVDGLFGDPCPLGKPMFSTPEEAYNYKLANYPESLSGY